MDELKKASEDVTRRLAWLDTILDSATEVSLAGRAVRNPAHAPRHVSDLLGKSEDAQVQRQNVEKFSRAVANMIDLVGSILDLSNIEAGHFELEQCEFELHEIVEQALGKVRPKAHPKRVALRCVLSPEIPKTILGDPLRLSDLLVNLVSNAVHYIQSGEIIVSALQDAANPNRLHFAVTGKGLSAAGEKPIDNFDDCADPDKVVTCRPGKTGMGLGFCRILARQLGSGLQVHTDTNGNSSFTFDILFPDPPKPAGHLTARAAAESTKARVLIAEDSEDCRFLLQEFLKSAHYDITFAENGRMAIEAYESEPFDLILMDIQMPVMDGLTATRLIREAEKRSGKTPVPIVALTANSRKTDIELSLVAGCSTHVRKPVSKIHLLNTIQQHLPSRPQPAKQAPVEVRIPDGLEEAAQRYILSRRNDMPRLQSLIEARDFEQLRILAHNLKGTGTSFGFPDLTRIGGQMECSANEENAADLTVQLADLGRYLMAAAEVVNMYPVQPPA